MPHEGLGATADDGLTAPASPIPAAEKPPRWSARQIFTLCFLTLVASFNYLDRSLLGLALPQIKGEMHVSDTALGLVSGLAFALFYSILCVPIAALADRRSRRNIIAVGFFFWSLMAGLTGYVSNVLQLAAARFLMGAGEACGVPPSSSMIGDLFPPAQRPSALAVFSTGVAISAIVFYPAASWIGQHYGWRAMFHIAGMIGMALAVIFFLTVREPVRGGFDKAGATNAASAPPVRETLRFLAGQKTYLLLLVSTVFEGAQLFGEGAWTATLLTRVHHLSIGQVGLTLGTVRGILSWTGILACGLATDRLGRRDPRWRIWAPALIGALFAPAETIFLLSDDGPVWFTGFCVASFFSYAPQSAVLAALISVAQVRMRALATALMMLCSSLLSQAIGPLAIGMFSDMLKPAAGDDALRYAMLTIVACIVAASIALMAAVRFYVADVARAGNGS